MQCLYPNGKKLIFGKKKGCFAPLGDLAQATRLYVCEGYATASAIFELVTSCQQRKVPFSVICALDAKNLETVSVLLKKTYPPTPPPNFLVEVEK